MRTGEGCANLSSEFAERGRGLSYQSEDRSCANRLGGLQAPKGADRPGRPLRGEAALRVGMQTLQGGWGCQGRLCQERVGGIACRLAQNQAGVPAGGPGHGAWDMCPVGGGPHLPCPAP